MEAAIGERSNPGFGPLPAVSLLFGIRYARADEGLGSGCHDKVCERRSRDAVTRGAGCAPL